AAHLVAALVHDDVHALAMGVVFVAVVVILVVAVVVAMIVVLVGVRVARHAVAAVEKAGADAKEPAFADPGHAQRAAVGAHGAARQGAVRELLPVPVLVPVMVVVVVWGLPERSAPGMAGDVVVAGLAVQRVEMEHEPARRGRAVEPQQAGALVVAAGGAQLGAPLQRRTGRAFGDAAIDHVD